MCSSFHPSVLSRFTSSAPVNCFGSQMPKAAPVGSAKTAMRPASSTSNGSMNAWPPASLTFAAVSSAFST